MTKPITGTREWAAYNVNCQNGCPHGCLYCYARASLVRYGRCPSIEAWSDPKLGFLKVRQHDVDKKRPKKDGSGMFPTTHDLDPREPYVTAWMTVLKKLLETGNKILVVSKPHLDSIERICRTFADRKGQILFRFSIGAMSTKRLAFWEPGAPTPEERFDCLKHAWQAGFATSVSAEPLLCEHVTGLIATVLRYVTDSVWLGKMNDIEHRVPEGTDPEQIKIIKAIQTNERIRIVYDTCRREPKVKYKESWKKVLGFDLAEKAGLDE